MKVLSWNMAGAYGYSLDKHDRAWRWLRNADHDVALLQEAVVPDWAGELWPTIIHAPKISGRIPWGCAVLSREDDLVPYELTGDDPWLREMWGAVVVAAPRSGDGTWFASIHSSEKVLGPERLAMPELAALRRCHPTKAWEIEAIAHDLERVLTGHRCIIGGDLNSGMLFDQVYRYENNARLWANLRDAGFHDLRPRHFPAEQQTYFRAGQHPYQLDHLFGDTATEAAVTSWVVHPAVVTDLELSDHAPVEVTLG